MVSKKLQDKFYAALESLRDGKNDYILEALAAGARATFEGLIGGEVTADGTYIPPKDERPDSAGIGPDSCTKILTLEDLRSLTHDPETEGEEEPEELNFEGGEAKRFPTYTGQFTEEEDPSYSMVAEAVAKLKRTIGSLKTQDNRSILEAIEQGCDACFGSGCTEDAPNKNWSVTVRVRNSIGEEGEMKYLVTAPDEKTACERAKNGVSADHPNLHPQDATAVPYAEY